MIFPEELASAHVVVTLRLCLGILRLPLVAQNRQVPVTDSLVHEIHARAKSGASCHLIIMLTCTAPCSSGHICYCRLSCQPVT